MYCASFSFIWRGDFQQFGKRCQIEKILSKWRERNLKRGEFTFCPFFIFWLFIFLLFFDLKQVFLQKNPSLKWESIILSTRFQMSTLFIFNYA